MTLAFRQYHKPNSTPLVLIHGFLGDGLLFSPNIQQLRKYHTVITVDLPGFGKNAKQLGATSINDMAQQAMATLEALSYPKFYLLGHSMGGMVALQMALAAQQKIAALILYATNSDGNLPERFETFAQTKARLQEDFAGAKRHICATWFCDGEQHQHFPLVLQCGADVQLQTALDAVDAMQNFNATAKAAQYNRPTLIIGAEKDKTYAPHVVRKLHTRIPQSQLHIMKNCAHNAHLEAEVKFNTLLLEWLAKQS